MKVSVCITVLNEEGSIGRLLESLVSQTKKPDEIIIVDGGSYDKTVEIIRHYQKKYSYIKCFVEKGSCAHGRNTAIDSAGNEIIALTDAGCWAKEDWLEAITHPFVHEKVGLVAGFYDMPASGPLQQAINVYRGISPSRFDPINFLPSARSVAFRKSIWEKIGGFNEKLDKAGEDTQFFYSCVKEGVKIVRVKEARVVWEEVRNMDLSASLRKFYGYAKGDAQTKIWWHPAKHLASHNIKISLIIIRYFAGIMILIYSIIHPATLYLLLTAIILYLLWPVYKWKDVVKSREARLWLPVVQISSDMVIMAGFVMGMIKKKKYIGCLNGKE